MTSFDSDPGFPHFLSSLKQEELTRESCPRAPSDALPLSVSFPPPGSVAFSIILIQGGRSVRRKLLTLICPTTHPLAHLMPEPRVGEGEEPTQPR